MALKAIEQFKESGAKNSLPLWLTLRDAAAYSGLPAQYLERQIRDGRLGAIDVGIDPGVYYCVARRDLDAISATAEPKPKPIQPETRGRAEKPVSLVDAQPVMAPFPQPKPIQREIQARITPAQVELDWTGLPKVQRAAAAGDKQAAQVLDAVTKANTPGEITQSSIQLQNWATAQQTTGLYGKAHVGSKDRGLNSRLRDTPNALTPSRPTAPVPSGPVTPSGQPIAAAATPAGLLIELRHSKHADCGTEAYEAGLFNRRPETG